MGKSLIITTSGGTDVEDGSPNATEAQVLSGYTFYALQDEPRMGDMPNHSGSNGQTLNPSGSHSIPLGFHDGGQEISTVTLKSQTGATSSAEEVLTGYSGWGNGSKVVGVMDIRGAASNALSANGTYTVPKGWHNGSGKVTQSISTQAATNVTPGTSQKTVIAASKWTTGNQIVLGNGNLTAANIKKNVTIFGVTGSYQIDVTQGYEANSGVNGGMITGNRWNQNNHYPSATPMGGMTSKGLLLSYPVATLNYYGNYFNVMHIEADLWCYCSTAYSTVYFWIAVSCDGSIADNKSQCIGSWISGKGLRPGKWDGKYSGHTSGNFYFKSWAYSSSLQIYQVLSVNDSSGDLYQEGRATNLSVTFKKV